MRSLVSLLVIAPLLSCGSETREQTGAHLAMSITPLGSSGIGEALWDIEVEDGNGQIVWQRRLSSSRFGDGRGALTYVGPCNAQAPDHTVRLWMAGLFEAPVANPGVFGGGADAAGSLIYMDPTSNAPLVQLATCAPDADTPVRFDVAVMRPANQGFFDIAVMFDDIFCSAKFDCCTDADGDGLCAADGSEDNLLLFNANGQRESTMTLGFACSIGPGEGATELFLDALWLDCTTEDGGFSVDIAVAPGGPVGNQCQVGADGMSQCAIVTEYGGADADDALYQVAVYRGLEALEIEGRPANKVYWNIALGVKRPNIASCALRTRGTAARSSGLGFADDGRIAEGAIYPLISWDVDIGACTQEALSFSQDGMVQVSYANSGTSFGYGYSSDAGVRAFCTSPCVCAGRALANGTSCDDGLACTRGDVCVDGVCAGVEACSEVPGECWQPDGSCGDGGACEFVPRASGEPCADDGNPCTVDRCDGAGACEHVAGNVGTLCRAAADLCDAEERCDGTTECPVDVKVAAGTECRPAVDGCDVAEFCQGGDACPSPSISFCGRCGAADGGSTLSTPVEGLCAVGEASEVVGAGPWSWTCAGQDGADASCGGARSCGATTLVFGACSVVVTEAEDAFEDLLDNQAAGQVGTVTARCDQGEWVQSEAWCDAIVDGVCGDASGGHSASAPAVGLCRSGTASAVAGQGPWTWTCDGAFGGGQASCTSYKTCAAGVQAWSNCSASTTAANRGATQSLSNTAAGYEGAATATCSASGDGIWSLSGTSCQTTVNGQCGAAHNGSTTAAPTAGLCANGEASAVSGGGPWSWTCTGAFGGTTASCGSNRSCSAQALSWGSCGGSQTAQAHGYSGSLANTTGGYTGSATATCSQGSWSTSETSCLQIVAGACGTANGGNTATAPSANLCATGNATAVGGSGPWTWTCNGLNGGSAAACTSYKTCAAGVQAWSNCSASTTIANRGATQSLTNGAAGYQGAATATCSASGDGIWSLSGTSCNATVNGQCGGSNGGSTTAAPSTGLCANGEASSVSGSGPWSWTCAGTFGGTTASCSSNRSCGAQSLSWGSCGGAQTAQAHGYSGSLANTTGGYTGSATATCSQGSWSTSNTSCSQVVAGTCGTANGGNTATAPSANLCATGNATAVGGSGPWTWTCNGLNGGSAAACTSYKTCAAGVQAWSNCSASTTAANRGATQSLTNGAAGYQGAATATCSASGDGIWSLSGTSCNATVNGQCGGSNGGSTTSAPSTGLCANGEASSVSGSGPWSWTCSGTFGGTTASCSSNRSCGAQSLSWGSCSGAQTAQSHGYSGSLSNSAGGYTGSATATCSQGSWSTSNTSCSQVVAGTCGTANGGNTATAPSTNLCATGNATAVGGSGPWSWTCNGLNGGGSAACTSYKTCAGGTQTWSNCSASTTTANRGATQSLTNGAAGYQGAATATCSASGDGIWSLSGTSCNATVNGQCGGSNGGSTTSAPTANLCTAGTASGVSGSGPYSWSCTGAFGGTTASCSSNRSCSAQSLSWGSCGASQGAQSHGYSGGLSNTTGGYTGSATATCSQGSWSLSNTSCLQVIAGTCGAANGGNTATAPGANLCATGNATAVGGSGPWTWTCNGINGGGSAGCTSYKTCAASALAWSSCGASTTAANRGATQALSNVNAGFNGSATATCDASGNGTWSLSNTSCAVAGCTPGTQEHCGSCHCGWYSRQCNAQGVWGSCNISNGCVDPQMHCP